MKRWATPIPKNSKHWSKFLRNWRERGILLLNKTGQFRLKVQGATLTGTFRSNDRGFGFVTVDPNESDLFVPRGKTGSAMDGRYGRVEDHPRSGALE